MWWTRVSFCALSLTFVLGAVGCGSSGFRGQGSSDSLTMSFQGLSERRARSAWVTNEPSACPGKDRFVLQRHLAPSSAFRTIVLIRGSEESRLPLAAGRAKPKNRLKNPPS